MEGETQTERNGRYARSGDSSESKKSSDFGEYSDSDEPWSVVKKKLRRDASVNTWYDFRIDTPVTEPKPKNRPDSPQRFLFLRNELN